MEHETGESVKVSLDLKRRVKKRAEATHYERPQKL